MQNKEEISFADLVGSEEFQKYCLDSGPEERAYWEQWLLDHPTKQQIFEEAKNWVIGLSSQISEAEIKQEFQQVLSKAELPALAAPKTRPMFRPWMGIAAGMLVLCAFLIYWQGDNAPQMQVYATDFGETQSINLPDGTEVILNANSSMKLAANWDAQQREVWLDGEGFFEVMHDPSNPFIVHTSQGDIKVLGTSFNAFQRAEKLSVTLIEGKVNLAVEKEEEIVMKPGEQVIITESGITQQDVDTEPIIAWKLGHLLFRDASIESIIERLKVEFNLEIEVAEKAILQKRIHAVIHQYDPEVLLNALAEIYDLDIEKRGERSFLIK
jgi:ferric-dicitrate binding protein FerR (iron transport regulator)